MGSSFLSAMAEYAEAPEKERAKLVVRYLTVLQPSMSTDEVRFFEAVGMRSRKEERAISKGPQGDLGMVRKEGEELRRDVLEQHRAAGIEGFRGSGARGGVLEVHTFGQTSVESLVEAHLKGDGDWLSGVDIADVLFEFLEQASEAVQAGNTYPLLDAPTAEFVAAVEGTGFAEVSASADRVTLLGFGRRPAPATAAVRAGENRRGVGHPPRSSGSAARVQASGRGVRAERSAPRPGNRVSLKRRRHFSGRRSSRRWRR